MGIKFNGSTVAQRIDFGALATVRNLTTKTIVIWFYPLTLPTSGNIINSILRLYPNTTFTDEEFQIYFYNDTGTHTILSFSVSWSVSYGLWNIDANVFTLNAWNQIIVTYNGGGVGNDPIIYVNKVSQAITKQSTPSGSLVTGTNNIFVLGQAFGTPALNGIEASILIYNRIFSQNDVNNSYNSRLFTPNYNSLVFVPNLYGAAGLQIFDGATLVANNKIVDEISGALGTPVGSPVGIADTVLNLGR